jgi:hypothetical protein
VIANQFLTFFTFFVSLFKKGILEAQIPAPLYFPTGLLQGASSKIMCKTMLFYSLNLSLPSPSPLNMQVVRKQTSV